MTDTSTTAGINSVITYEPYDDESRLHQFDLYKQMREHAPVYLTESGWWCISRYDDVREVLLSPEKFSSEIVQVEAFGLPTSIDPNMDAEQLQILLAVVSGMPVPVEELLTGRVIVVADPPDHTRMRRIVNRGFTARRMNELRPKIEKIVADLLEGIAEADSFEVVKGLANEVPLRVIGDFLSADPHDLHRIRGWVDVSMECSFGAMRGTPEAQAKLLAMLKDFGNYFVPRIEERRTAPRDDLISDLVKASEAETLTVTEAMLFLLSIMVAGSESTASLIGSAVVELLRNPDQLALLEADPGLARGAAADQLRGADGRVPGAFGLRTEPPVRQHRADLLVAGDQPRRAAVPQRDTAGGNRPAQPGELLGRVERAASGHRIGRVERRHGPQVNVLIQLVRLTM